MEKHPESYIDLESALREKELTKDELESFLNEVKENRDRHYEILESLAERGSKFLRYNLLLLALGATSVSMLFQTDVIGSISALDSWLIVVPFSFVSASLLLSIVSVIPLSWSRENLVSRYESRKRIELGSKDSTESEIRDQIEVVQELRGMVLRRNFTVFTAQLALMLAFLSTFLPLIKVFSVSKILLIVMVALLSLVLLLIYDKYKVELR